MRRAWGADLADKLKLRLAQLEAADSLADMALLPGCRCHELKGDWKGQLAIDLVHPHRLLLRPDHDPLPAKEDGGLDWEMITQVLVIEVVDYH